MPQNISCPSRRLPRWTAALICLALLFSTAAAAPERSQPVQVTHVCLITAKFKQMADFYRQVLQLEPKRFQDDYLEFQTPGAIISLYQKDSFQKIAPQANFQTATSGMMLELQVPDADKEYARLQTLNLSLHFILPPTSFPWGNRSIYLTDPDGNLLNIYSLVPGK